MAYRESEGRELVAKAGRKLVESGLIARTWGNISARISDTQFVITPSGMAYETLKPEQVVVVNISDCSYNGNIKPSSEKGIHADVYRLRPEVNFVIHTHQTMASVVSVAGEHLTGFASYGMQYSRILGDIIPCAAYGMPSTGKLRRAVASAAVAYPQSKAVLMRYHGALCMGSNFENAFEISKLLEEVAAKKIAEQCRTKFGQIADLGADTRKLYLNKLGRQPELLEYISDAEMSIRHGGKFVYESKSGCAEYAVNSLPDSVSNMVRIHAEIYRHSDVTNIIHMKAPDVVTVSIAGKTMKPLLDDLAQIAGVNVKCVTQDGKNAATVTKKLKGRNAVLIQDEGALCTGKTKSEAEAVCMVLDKGCQAEIFSAFLEKRHPLNIADAFIQRIVYVLKYSKLRK